MYLGALPPRGAGHTFCSKSGKYAAPGLGCHRCYSACCGEKTQGEVISNPGRRLALCVTPYFADRGVGDMRGPPNGVPNMPPRRWWQAVIAPHNHVVHKMIHTAPRREHSPAPPPGCDLGRAIWHAPHVATTPRGEIRGYAQLPPPPGWRKCSPPVIVSAVAEMRMLRMLVTWSGAHFLPCGHSTSPFSCTKIPLFDIF